MQSLRSAARDYAALPRLFWTLWAGVLVNRIGVMVLPFLGLYLTTEGGLSAEQAGLVVGAYGVGQIAASWAGGVLADRVGRKFTIMASLLGGAFWMLVLKHAHGVPASVAAVFALACFAETYRPAFGALISDIVPEPLRYLAYAANHWAINLGFAVAMFLGGMLSSYGYALVFYVDAGTTLLYAALVALKVPETRGAVTKGPTREPSVWRHMLADRSFLWFLGLTFSLALVFSQAIFTLSLYLGSIGFDSRVFGSLMAVNGLLIVVAQPVVVRLTRRISVERIFVVAALLQGIGFGLHGASASGAGQLLALVVWTAGEIASVPISATVVAALAPAQARGRYQGVYAMVWSLAIACGPWLGGLVLSRLGATVLWGGCVAVGIMSAVLARASGALRHLSPARAD